MNNNDYWFPWYPSLFQANTLNLTLEQDAIYRRLIDHYMLTREPLPENTGALARIVGCPIEIIEKNAAVILDAYFSHSNGTYSHDKCDEILDEQDKRTIKKSKAGKKAAEKRWKNRGKQTTENKQENAAVITDPMRIDATGQDRTGQDKDKESIGELQTALDLYNETASRVGLSQAQVLSNTRKAKLRKRLKQAGGLDGWKTALERMEKSSFLTGNNDNGWKATLDFLLQESSFIKLMEGNYCDRNRKPKQGSAEYNAQRLQEWVEEDEVDK